MTAADAPLVPHADAGAQADDAVPLAAPSRAFLLTAFFLSGAVALGYEVAWSRALLLLLGSTAASSAVVLGVFVGFLGWGARWGGTRAERHASPLKLYGICEIGAAAWAVIAPAFVGLLESPYVAVASSAPGWLQMPLRVFVAVLVIAPAAFLLGATLPAMVRHWVRRSGETGRQTAWLYGANTVGAFAGALFTGYVGVAWWGVYGMVLVAAALGAAVGLAALVFALRGKAVTPLAAHANNPPGGRSWKAPPPAARVALVCGLIGLATEVIGFRILVFFLEGFTVTFASMLGVFIAGLGIGSLVLGPILARTNRPARALGVLLLLQAATLLLGLLLVVPSLESWMQSIRGITYEGAASPADIAAGLRTASLLGAAALLFLPALLMGPTFPLCVRWSEIEGHAPGFAVGRTYLWNSIGSLFAPFLVTFMVIPLFHVTGAWVLVTFLAAFSGANLCLFHRWQSGRKASIHIAALLGLSVGVGLILLEPPGVRPTDLVEASVVVKGAEGRRLLRVASDSVTTASVIESSEGERYLYTDDFAAAATGRHYRYMRMLGHLPCLLARDPKNAMVIAFGTGTTAGAVAEHEGVKRLEVVEVSRAVLELASHFQLANRDVLSDPRVVQVKDDGRNALLLHEPDLDVITLEPLMPYSPQGYPFYTREFYELARDRLTEGGVLCQWVPVHAMPVGLYAAFVRTFFEVFPEGSLWFFEQSTALVGHKGTARPDAETLDARLAAIASDLEDAGFADPALFRSAYLASGRDILAQPRLRRPLMRDGHPYAEFEPTPRAPLNTPYLNQTLRYLFSLVEPKAIESPEPWHPDLRTRTATQFALAGRWKEAEADFLGVSMRGMPREAPAFAERQAAQIKALEDAARRYEAALRRMPEERVLQWRLVRAFRKVAAIRVRDLLGRAASAERQGEASQRDEALHLALDLTRAVIPPAVFDPDPIATGRIEAAARCAAVLLRLGRCAEALRVLREARIDLDDARRESRLTRLIEHVAARQGGTPFTPAEADAWVFEDARTCRAEGTEPVKGPLKAFRQALTGPERALRLALRRLVLAAQKHGVEEATLAELVAPEGARRAVRVLVAAARRTLDDRELGLEALLRSEDVETRQAALIEAGWWRLLRHDLAAVDAAREHADAGVRRALATAVAEHGHFDVLRRIAALLMDADLDVRTEAFTVFLKHRPNVIEGYDPNGPEAERRTVYEAVERNLR